MDPIARRKKIDEMAAADADYQKARAEFDRAREAFDRFVLTLPAEERNLLRSYPGMGILLHHKMLNLICDHMRFEDET